MRQAGSVALLSMAAVLVIGATGVVKREGDVVATTAAGPREIEAKSFVLLDPLGKKRAILGMTAEGPELSLLDSAGKERGSFGLRDQGPHLSLNDASRKTRAMLDLKATGPSLVLADGDQVRQTRLSVGSSEMGLALTTGGSRLVPLIELVERTGGGAREVNKYHELRLFDPDGKGRSQVFLVVLPDASSDFGLRNSAGLAVFRKP